MNGLAGTATNVRLQSGDLKMKFFACLVKVRSDVYNSIATARLQRNLDVYYPTARSEIRTYTIQNNQASFEATDVFNGRVPDRVVVGFLQQSCFTGSHAYNPFNFEKAKISTIKQVVEGEEYPFLPMELNAGDDEKDMEGYHRPIKASCADWRRKCMIEPEHWGEGKHTTLFTWDNVASGCADSVSLNPKQEGRVKIDVRKTGEGHMIVMIVYGEFENMIKPTGATQYDIYSQQLAGRIQEKTMEFVPFTTQQLSYLAKQDACLAPIF